MTDQLFKDEPNSNPQATPDNNTPSVNPDDLFADQLAAIKNEQGAPKYDSVEKAIEALQHSQQYIPELKDKLSSQEAMISELQAKLEATEKVQDIVNQQTTPNDVQNTNEPSLSAEQVAELVTQKLEQQKALSTQEQNQISVNNTLTERFGTEAPAEVAKKAKELGMKPSELGELSKKNPAMVLALFGEKQSGSPSPSLGSVRTPQDTPEVKPLSKPDKSLLSGATAKEQAEFMAKVREEVYRKHGITQ